MLTEADILFVGKFTLDDDTYHRVVKPLFIKEFSGDRSFSKLCGTNPDFMIDRSGDVYPSAVGNLKSKGLCTKVRTRDCIPMPVACKLMVFIIVGKVHQEPGPYCDFSSAEAFS